MVPVSSSKETDEEMLKHILATILRSSPGIRSVILMDRSGLLIQSEHKFTVDPNLDLERIGAIAGALFQAGEEQGETLNYAELELQISEYKLGILICVSCGSGVLCVASDKNIQVGLLRTMLKKFSPNIANILKTFLESDETTIAQELKGLFDDSLNFK
ncbi:MAG: regulator protein [Promethearchaeota archaeon CR_4]|nr:MAG: regulator protein [Candidatus Lokiarchaeota archaeon CR_4]